MIRTDENSIRIKDPFHRPWMINNSVASGVQRSFNYKAALAGGITGAVELVFSYPFDYIKTQLQLSKNSDKVRNMKTLYDVIKGTMVKEGIRGFYCGLPIVVVFDIPKESIRFGVYETLKDFYHGGHKSEFNSDSFFNGLGAGICEAVFVTPMETMKVQFIRDQFDVNPKYKGAFVDSVFKIIEIQGIKGLYRGLTPTLIKSGSNQAIRFYIVETSKNEYRGGDRTIKIPPPVVGLFGVVAGLVSALVNNPIDVIKTRMQGYNEVNNKNTFDCAKNIFMEEGFSAFYKGLKARMIRVAIDVGFSFMIFDIVLDIFNDIFPN